MSTTATPNNAHLDVLETVTVTASSAYAAKNTLGGLITIANAVERAGAAVRVLQAVLYDQAMQSIDADVVLFNANPDGTTIADKTDLDVADADLSKVAGVLQVTTDALWKDNGVAFGNPANPPLVRLSGTSLYAAIVARTTPTFAATTDVALRLVLERV